MLSLYFRPTSFIHQSTVKIFAFASYRKLNLFKCRFTAQLWSKKHVIYFTCYLKASNRRGRTTKLWRRFGQTEIESILVSGFSSFLFTVAFFHNARRMRFFLAPFSRSEIVIANIFSKLALFLLLRKFLSHPPNQTVYS